MTIVVTGGAGFIGANFILDWLALNDEAVVNIDKLTYAGNLENLASIGVDKRYTFVHGDISDRQLLDQVLTTHRPRAVLNFAAESHVDRSIAGPNPFIETNILGTFNLLEACLSYARTLGVADSDRFRLLQVSTDEVFGSLGADDHPFSETTPYAPNSPYSASKAAADHLVRSYFHTFGLPTLTTNCSNNYGPFQNPEKLIPLVIDRALRGQIIPIFGDGQNVRDWLYVSDHCSAIRTVLERARPGDTFAIGGNSEMRNVDIVAAVCQLLDTLVPRGAPHADLIAFVADRAGHDRRYGINSTKIETELGWRPQEDFASGISRTVQWYLDNRGWVSRCLERQHATS